MKDALGVDWVPVYEFDICGCPHRIVEAKGHGCMRHRVQTRVHGNEITDEWRTIEGGGLNSLIGWHLMELVATAYREETVKGTGEDEGRG